MGVLAAPDAAASIAPGTASKAAGILTAKAIAKTTGVLIDALEEFTELNFPRDLDFVEQQMALRYPDVPDVEKRPIIDWEQRFENEFRRKMRERLKKDLPPALSVTDPDERAKAVQGILDRERYYSRLRAEAMVARALGKLEARLLERLSPEGAYWQLSPSVKSHTIDCLAMGEKFWPWSVLKKIQPPLHPNCPCKLLGLDEAVEAGLMERDQVPDPDDAERRYELLKKKIAELEDRDDLQEALVEVLDEIEHRNADEAVEWGELRGAAAGHLLREDRHRHPLRWMKGFEKGGQFRPERGGSPGAAVIRRLLGRTESPLRGRQRGAGRWAWVRGVYTRIPEQKRWERRTGGSLYHSPAGSTTVYRDGIPISDHGGDEPRAERVLRSPGTATLPPSAEQATELIRTALRAPRERRSGKLPIAKGDSPSQVLALESDHGFVLARATPKGGGVELEYRTPQGAEVMVTFDGNGVTDVSAPTKRPQERKSIGGRAPLDWNEFVSDSLAWADELGQQYGAEVAVPDIHVDEQLPDHAGTHQWTGDVEVGGETDNDIAIAGEARAAERALTEDEMRGLYSSYWVTAHEIAHGVNQINPMDFRGANANLEEALTEEISHLLAVTRLTEQGQLDVVDWRARHPEALAVQGVYPEVRFALGGLFDMAGITNGRERRLLLEELKFRVDPAERLDVLASLIHGQRPEEPLDAIRDQVESALAYPDVAAATHGSPILPDFDTSPGMGEVGDLRYGYLAHGALSTDGETLTLPDGSVRRIEKLPLLPGSPELSGLTDGSAIANYPPGVKFTDGLTLKDGSPKNFRYTDDHERAKTILRAIAGKGSPGVGYEADAKEVADVAARIKRGGVTYVRDEVPVKKRFDGSYGVGFAGRDGRNLSGIVGADNAAKLALYRADNRHTLLPQRLPGPDPTQGDAPPATEDFDQAVSELLLPDPPQSPGVWIPFFGDGKKKKGKGKKGGQKPLFDTKKPKPPKPVFIGGQEDVPNEGPIPNYDATRLELKGYAGGSNGARWGFDKNDHRWLVKTYRGDQDRIATELLSNRIYALMGAKVADAGTITVNDKPALTYPTLDGKERQYTFRDNGPNEEVAQHYMVDALLANWDYVGLSDDNIMWDPEGHPFRVDQGGTLEFRAMGQTKPFGPVPTEVWTMIQKGQGKRAVGDLLSEEDMRAQAAEIVKTLTPQKLDALIDATPFADEKMRERVRENLKARIAWMDSFAKGQVELPKPAEGEQARDAFLDSQEQFEVFPEEAQSLSWYTGGGALKVHDWLKGDHKKDESPPSDVKAAVKSLDAMLKDARTPEDMYLYVGIDFDLSRLGDDLDGKTLEEKSFMHATTDRESAERAPGLIRLMLPEGSHALYLPGLHDLEDRTPAEPQVIIRRDSRLKITGRKTEDGRTVLEATVLPPKQTYFYKPPKPTKKSLPAKPKKGKGYEGDWQPSGGMPEQGSIWDDIEPPKSPGVAVATGRGPSGFVYPLGPVPKGGQDLPPDRKHVASLRPRSYIEYEASQAAQRKRLGEAAEQPTGVMVALYPPPSVATALAVKGGEPPEELHLTLAFLGKAAELAESAGCLEAVRAWAAETPPFEGEISGIGHFAGNPDGAGGQVCYASVDLPVLPERREELVRALDGAGYPPSRDHGFTPHITLDYASRRPRLELPMPISFDRVVLAWAGDHHSFPLTGEGNG